MPWWKSGNNSSSSSASITSSSSPERSRKDLGYIWNRRNLRQPRLTRQKKLRHLSDGQVGDLVGGEEARSGNGWAGGGGNGGGGAQGFSGGGAAKSTPVSRTTSTLDNAPPRTSISVPQPLPLPESASVSPCRDSGLGRHPLSWAKGPSAPGSSEADDRNGHVELSSFLAEPIGERLSAVSVVGSRLSQPTARKSSEHADFSLAGSNYAHSKHDSNTTDDTYFRLSTPDRSSVTSGLSSPALSPRRMSTGDFFQCTCMFPQVPQIWSAPELPSLDIMTGSTSRTSVDKVFPSPERSPRYSPKVKIPGLRSTNPSTPSSPLHPKVFPENSPAWHDCNGNANLHPLPLPPGAPVSLQAPLSHQTTKAELSSMANQWQKGKLIGSGTFGNVYVATNRHTGALCAMKEVNLIPDDPKSAECVKQLQQEIKLLSRLKHPNIVQYYGSEIIEDRFYIYLEYVYPGSINKYVHEHCGAVTESVVRNFTRHILRGLAYLHSTKTMHRDIKGANLLVDSCGVVKLADFGMAKHLTGAKDVLSMRGTPYWMAPEVLQATMNKELSYDLAIDIWSLGCTIIEMFTGKHPWSGFESAAAMFKVLHESPQIPETLSAEGKDFLQHCFRRNPNERPTASQLLEHPFITYSHHHDLHNSVQAFAGVTLSDGLYRPKNNIKFNSDSNVKGKYSFNGYGGTSPPTVPFKI